jgi:hypothetical protein
MKNPKVFGVGFHKTGTKSLASALTHLGYRVCGPNGVGNPNIAVEARQIAFELTEQYDAFQDNPWPIFYRELYHRYPDAKFILTIRPVDAWIRSAVQHFGTQSTPMREWIYGVGSPRGNEESYVSRYQRHNREVMDYFSDKPKQLLVLDITAGEGWEKLCPFLDCEVPEIKFPYANSAASRAVRAH